MRSVSHVDGADDKHEDVEATTSVIKTSASSLHTHTTTTSLSSSSRVTGAGQSSHSPTVMLSATPNTLPGNPSRRVPREHRIFASRPGTATTTSARAAAGNRSQRSTDRVTAPSDPTSHYSVPHVAAARVPRATSAALPPKVTLMPCQRAANASRLGADGAIRRTRSGTVLSLEPDSDHAVNTGDQGDVEFESGTVAAIGPSMTAEEEDTVVVGQVVSVSVSDSTDN